MGCGLSTVHPVEQLKRQRVVGLAAPVGQSFQHLAQLRVRLPFGLQRNKFATWCAGEGRVARPCTTATFLDYVAHLIVLGRSPNAAMSSILTWMPEGTKQARGMLNEYKKAWAKRTSARKVPRSRTSCYGPWSPREDFGPTPGDATGACSSSAGAPSTRRIELADLSIADVAVDDGYVTLRIRSSKTDQEAKSSTPTSPQKTTRFSIPWRP
ncbi:hypothetical protein [Streptomyces parvus]|uniref:hypothetical protein n=1 Tax=Streptomyces parvus TaxID=66428 RepID=UPI0033EA0405